MTTIEVLGYVAASIIGLSLGMIGGGGSILTIPVLVYMFGISPVLATAYSLFVVGVSSLFGSLSYMKKGLLNYKTAIVFAIPSFIAVFLTRKLLIPFLPDNLLSLTGDWGFELWFGVALVMGIILSAIVIMKWGVHQNTHVLKVALLMLPATIMVFTMRQWVIPSLPSEMLQFGDFVLTKNLGIMLLFALVMIGASISMIRGRSETDESEINKKLNVPIIVVEGALVGTLTGVVGAGGGFLIIPALVLIAGLPMKQAVGTSLLIITVKSLIGFLGDVSNRPIDWTFLLTFTGLAVIGILIGTKLSDLIPARVLKKSFGWFVLGMAIFILFKELT